jgi:hypothetical protein
MNITNEILSSIYKLRADNIEPTLITIGKNNFDMLRFEVESASSVKVNKDSNHFMGIPIKISEDINFLQVS